MRYVFGPVPSRRLGRSLGIDPVPYKTCNWNCVYCQLGHTSPPTGERRGYFPKDDIVEEVREAVERNEAIDWITFAGSGEPTLHARLGWMIEEIKKFTELPIAVLTNGSFLNLQEVRDDLKPVEAVLPTLDAGSEDLYLRINRPRRGFEYQMLVDGLIAFREEYEGRLWIEVMLIRGLNDTHEALSDLAEVLHRIGPDEVHLNLPVRPPAEPWVEPPDEEGIRRATEVLGDVARVIPVCEGPATLHASGGGVVDAILGVITRHPMSEKELLTLRPWTAETILDALSELEEQGHAQVVTRGGRRFWCHSGGKYAENRREPGS